MGVVMDGEVSVRKADEFVPALPMEQIVASRFNPRTCFDKMKLEQLAGSIRRNGLLQPIVVRRFVVRTEAEIRRELDEVVGEVRAIAERYDRPFPAHQDLEEHLMAHSDYCRSFEGAMIDGHGVLVEQLREEQRKAKLGVTEYYEICAGERRWRAAKIAEVTTIKAIVRDLDDDQALEVAVSENEDRENLNPIDRARGFKALLDRSGETQVVVADQLGMAESTFANAIRLLGLPDEHRQMVQSGRISASMGRALLSYTEYPELLQVKTEQALNDVPSREVEKIGNSEIWDLQRKGLVISLRSADVGVDQSKLCAKCGHRRKDGNRDGWICLKPECAQDKQQAWTVEEARRSAKEAGLPENAKILDLGKVGYGNWKNAYECIFAECKVCTAWQMGREYSGKPKKVCTDMKCFRRLSNANVRLVNKARRAEVDAKMARAVELLDGGRQDGPKNRIIVLACLEAIRQATASINQSILKRHGISVDLSQNLSYGLTPERFAELERLAESGELLKIAAEVMVAQDAKTRREFDGHKAMLLEYLIGDGMDDYRGPGPDMGQDDLRELIDARCSGCDACVPGMYACSDNIPAGAVCKESAGPSETVRSIYVVEICPLGRALGAQEVVS